MSYLNPRDVTAPKKQWKFIEIIYDLGEDDHSVALGTWEESLCLASRWNGSLDFKPRKKGNPISNFQPTWFILPRPIAYATFRELLVKSAEGDKSINETALKKAAAIFITTK